jgi:2-amino-4-hydroxy-6-hydroxymethyldihydropteridine diphosphokinase
LLSVTDQKQLVYPTNYYIALGTNVGNYRNNLSKALVELGKIGHVVKVAHIYKSKPYGYLKQNFFYNSMVCLKSEMLPSQLINKIQLIERKLKKNKRIINGPRKIDLDIIFWDYKIIKIQELLFPIQEHQKEILFIAHLQDINPFKTSS